MTKATGITPPSYDDVMSTCWCDQSFVWVKPADVLNGRTDTCHRPDCKPLVKTTRPPAEPLTDTQKR